MPIKVTKLTKIPIFLINNDTSQTQQEKHLANDQSILWIKHKL